MDPQHNRHEIPQEVVTWLLGSSPRTVVVLDDPDLARAFAAQGHDVTDVTGAARTEALPFPDRAVDAVVSTRGVPRDLDDVARVLRRGGCLGVVHRRRDQRIPWARKLEAVLDLQAAVDEPAARIADSDLFGDVSREEFRHWQMVNNQTLPEVLEPELSHLEESTRQRRLAAALELYDDYGRGADGMQLPWVSHCFRAEAVGTDRSTDEGDADASGGASDGVRSTVKVVDEDRASAPQDGSDSDLLLIDFR